MGTSGTVATTVLDNAGIIEHAFRRVRVLPSAQTPETIQIARECLYMLCLNLGNRGLNLWCVEEALIGLKAGQSQYTMPAGTLDVLNVIFSQPTMLTTTYSAVATGARATTATLSMGMRVGVIFAADCTGALVLNTSTDGINFIQDSSTPIASYTAGAYYWFDFETADNALVFEVIGAGTFVPSITTLTVVSTSYDLPLTQWNRDTYAAMNNKQQQGHPSTNYFLEKKLNPTLTLWPVPDRDTDHLLIYRHRQPQDVGTLIQQLEVPQRWMDGFIWLLASRLCFELPNVDTQLATLVVQMADKQVFEAEDAETDGAPIYLTPGIGVYSR